MPKSKATYSTASSKGVISAISTMLCPRLLSKRFLAFVNLFSAGISFLEVGMSVTHLLTFPPHLGSPSDYHRTRDRWHKKLQDSKEHVIVITCDGYRYLLITSCSRRAGYRHFSVGIGRTACSDTTGVLQKCPRESLAGFGFNVDCIKRFGSRRDSRSFTRGIQGKLSTKKSKSEIGRDPSNNQKQYKYKRKFDEGLAFGI